MNSTFNDSSDDTTEGTVSPSLSMFESENAFGPTSTPTSSPEPSNRQWNDIPEELLLLSSPRDETSSSSSSDDETPQMPSLPIVADNVRCFNFDALLLLIDLEIAKYERIQRRKALKAKNIVREEEIAWLYNYPAHELQRVWSQFKSTTFALQQPIIYNPEFDEYSSTYYQSEPLDIYENYSEYLKNIMEVFEEPKEKKVEEKDDEEDEEDEDEDNNTANETESTSVSELTTESDDKIQDEEETTEDK